MKGLNLKQGTTKIKIAIIAIVVAILAMFGLKTVVTKNNLTKQNELQAFTVDYDQITEEEEYVDGNENLIFSAFFAKDLDGDGRAERLLGSCNQTGKSDTLFINVGVQSKGFLKDGKIYIRAKEGYSKNYTYKVAMIKDDVLSRNYINDNVTFIELNTINAGIQELISGSINDAISDPTAYSSVSEIYFTGTYVDEEGVETPVEKTVDITTDWYGTGATTISGSSNEYNFDNISPEENIVVKYTITDGTTGLLPQERIVTTTVPEIFGFYPEVSYENSNIDEYSYDEESHVLTIDQRTTATKTQHTIILTYPAELYSALQAKLSDTASYNVYVPISAYSICYNNPHDENNPYRTSTVSSSAIINFYIKQPTGDEFVANMEILNKDWLGNNDFGWSKNEFLDLYDSEESQKYEFDVRAYTKRNKLYYKEKVTVYNGNSYESIVGDGYINDFVSTAEPDADSISGVIESAGIEIENGIFKFEGEEGKEITITKRYTPKRLEQRDDGDTFGRYNAGDFCTTKSIAFVTTTAIPTSGYIRIYDNNTNELIKEFTDGEWTNYNASNPYILEEAITNVRIETSEDDNKKLGSLEVILHKEIDIDKMKEKISRAELENVSYFQSAIIFTLYDGNVRGDTLNIYDVCTLYNIKSYSGISTKPDSIEVSDEEIPMTFTISVPEENSKRPSKTVGEWLDGVFLVKIPKNSITKLKVNNVTVNNPNIKIEYYEYEEKDDEYCITVHTSNIGVSETDVNGTIISEPRKEKNFSIKIDGNVQINPVSGSNTQHIELYAYNKALEIYGTEVKDIYDLDEDGSVNDYVGYNYANLDIVAPGNFRATESVTNYSDNNNEIEIFAPNTVEITKGTRQATINVKFLNNYKSDITNLKILGKIPFEGNTYVSGESLKSTYSTTMTSDGVTLPDDLKNIATVYYSEVEDPTTDVNDASNGWKLKENVTSFDDIKTYLVVVDGGNLTKGKIYNITYNVQIPEDIDSNKVSYACFKATFDLYTNGGLLGVELQPSKLGLRMVQYYDFNVNKYKEGTTHPASGVVFSLTEEDEDENEANQKIITSTDAGIIINKLRVNQIYYLREINGGLYETKDGVIKFRVVKDETTGLKVEILEGSTTNFDSEVTFTKNADGRYVLNSSIEDPAKVKMVVTKIDQTTNEPIPGVQFILVGNGTGTLYKTDTNGNIQMILSTGKEYTLKEYSAEGYYLKDDITFTVVKQNGGYVIESNDENFANTNVKNGEDSDYIDVAITITNQEIPKYNLQIKKVDANKNIPLQNVVFLLEKKDQRTSAYYTTDENGIIDISNLYEYVEGKNITGKYTLQEVSTKNGYLLNEEQIEFYVTRGEDNKLQIHMQNEDLTETVKDATGDETKVTLTITNTPLFRLIKINGESKEKLANVQFILYVLDEDGKEADYAKDIYGEYVGAQNSNGEYILTTDENGEISLALPNGNYKIVEYSFLEGYEETTKIEYFTITGNLQDQNEEGDEGTGEGTGSSESDEEEEEADEDATSQKSEKLYVEYIEDLVDIAKGNANPNTYRNTEIILTKTLDFNENSSYRDATDTSYGDINEDGEVSDIKTELTTGKGYLPIGEKQETPFLGDFDGQGYEIKNIYISGRTGAGLFGYINANTIIKNVTVTGEIKNSFQAGGICGVVQGTSTIKNCINYCNISNDESYSACDWGGIVGKVENGSLLKITSCKNYGEFNETSGSTGGIIGNECGLAIISKCENHGDLKSTDTSGGYVGGIVGVLGTYGGANYNPSTITSCKNYGNIIVNKSLVGGFVGTNYCDLEISKCDNYGVIVAGTTNNHVNSVAGFVGSPNASKLTINKCYNHSDISVYGYHIGGFVGYARTGTVSIENSGNEGDINIIECDFLGYCGGFAGLVSTCNISNSYNTGNVTIVKWKYSPNTAYVGGLIGGDYNTNGTIENSYNTGDITIPEAQGSYVGGLLGRGANQVINCYNEGDINVTSDTGTFAVGGLVGQSSSTEIQNSYNKGNINASTKSWSHTGGITGRYGRIAYCYNEGDIIFNSTYGGYVAGISGSNETVEYCYNTGNITGIDTYNSTFYVAGIVGSGSISNSYNTGTIEGNTQGYLYIGGIGGIGTASKCYNTGSVSGTAYDLYIGGIAGDGNISMSYNTADISGSTNGYDAHIGGITGNGKADYCHNTGDIESEGNVTSVLEGGIAGSGDVTLSFNTGNIRNIAVGNIEYIGGITGNGNVENAYNMGYIENNTVVTGNRPVVYVGGIVGSSSGESYYEYNFITGTYTGWSRGVTNYVYNTGDVINNVAGDKSNALIYTGPIAGYITVDDDHVLVYRDDIDVIGDNLNHSANPYIGEAKSSEYMKSNEMYDIIKVGAPESWKHIRGHYPTLDIPMAVGGATEITEITIENKALTFDITTEIAEDEDGNRLGGTITGEFIDSTRYAETQYKKLVETVAYSNNATKDIVIVPSEGYKIEYIKINGEDFDYSSEDSQVTIPASYFTSVKEDNHVVVKFGLIEKLATIKKVGPNGEKLSGAIFSIEEIDEREAPDESVLGELVDNGQVYSSADLDRTANDLLGEMTDNGDYVFVEQADGTYKPSNGGADGAKGKIAYSYIKIDLSDKQGKNYYVSVNATQVSSYYNDFAYFAVNQSTSAPTSGYATLRNNQSGDFMYNYKLIGGNTYYLHCAFVHNNNSTGDNNVTINSVNLYEEKTEQYNFTKENGKYVSTNQGKDGKNCSSYVLLNLEGLEGKYKVIVNAQISSQETYDRGTVSISDEATVSTNIVNITGQKAAKDYSTVVEGGKTYKITMTYTNGIVNTDNADDTFTINNIRVELDKSDIYCDNSARTNNDGEVLRDLHYGKYKITEVHAPEGYSLNKDAVILEIGDGTNNEVIVEDAKQKVVVAHFFLKGTGPEFNNEPIRVKMDVYYYGDLGETYNTWNDKNLVINTPERNKPKLQNKPYKLIQEDGEPVIPGNATGTFGIDENGNAVDQIDVYYYYELSQGSFKLEMTKVCENDGTTIVEGAEFTVYKINGAERVKIGTLQDKGEGLYATDDLVLDEEGDIELLLTETKVPEGYEAVEDINILITVEYDEENDNYIVTDTTYGNVDFESQQRNENVIKGTIEEPLKELNYEVHYFIDGQEDTNLAETNLTALYGSKISTYPDKTPRGYALDYVKALDENGEEADLPLVIKLDESKNIINVYYKKTTGVYKLNVTKVSENDPTKTVEGAEFTVYETTGTAITEVGKLRDIGEGKYETEDIEIEQEGTINILIEETKVPNGYKPVESITGTITVEFDEEENVYVITETSLGAISVASKNSSRNSINFTIEEPEIVEITGSYKLDVTKVNKADNSIKVTGAEFTVYETSGTEITEVGTLKDIGEGKYETENIEIKQEGIINVIIKETKVPEGYNRVEDITGTIKVEIDEENNSYVVTETSFGNVSNNNGNTISFTIEEPENANITVMYVDNITGEEIIPATVIPGIVGETYTVQRKDIPGFKIDVDNIPTNETGTITSGGVVVKYTYIELRPYEVLVRYLGGEVGVDEAKIAVEFGDTRIENYTTNGILKVADIELTDLATETYTVYETETPEYCKTVVSKQSPAIVELIEQLNEDENKYEFIANYEEIDGFKVIIDEENHKVIFEITTEKNEKYDLALQKFISNIDGTEITTREPKVLISADGKVSYVGNNEIEKVSNKQQVTYTIRMYNESTVRAKGKQVVEYIPDGLVFVPDNETNKKFEWKMYGVGAEGKPFLTSNPEEAVIVVSNYLVDEKIKALDVENGEVSYLDIQAVFKVDETKLTSDDRIIENKVQIMPNINDDNTENDITTEKLYVKYFDLSIEKYIAEVKVNTNGAETIKQVGYDQKGQLVKVDVKRSEAPNTKLTVTYGLLIKNVGEIPGYATEITDYIPQNFELVNNNGEWIVNGNKAISTSLSNKLINPGESEVIEITFEWNLAEGEIGTRRNEAEITAYANDYDAEDVTKDNKDGEDILVTLKTGSQAIAGITIIAIFTSIVALGVFEIRRKI